MAPLMTLSKLCSGAFIDHAKVNQYKACITNIPLLCEEMEASDSHGVGHTII